MLVLTRHPGQKILIGNNVVVTILKAESGRVSVGIDAPVEINIARAEIARKPPVELKGGK
jgi:carbon storage regulator